jgi:hypothetical protein
MPRNARAEARRESKLLRRVDLKRCAVCGKHLIRLRRKGWAYSFRCQQRFEEGQASDGP